MNASWLRESSGVVTLSVKVHPRAPVNSVQSLSGPELHVRLAAPPVDNEANVELIRFFSELLDCPRSAIRIRTGHKSRHKIVEIVGLSLEAVAKRILSSTISGHEPDK